LWSGDAQVVGPEPATLSVGGPGEAVVLGRNDRKGGEGLQRGAVSHESDHRVGGRCCGGHGLDWVPAWGQAVSDYRGEDDELFV
jgi:hypothetical protein